MSHLSRVFLASALLFIAVISVARGQSSYDLLGSARSSALGFATTAFSDAVGVHANPAAAAAHEHRAVTFFARESFLMAALRYGAAYGTWPAQWGVVSAGASAFGTDAYRETQFSLGYSRSVQLGTSREIHLGATARYYHTSIEGYGQAGALGLHLGLQVALLPVLTLGAHATNVNRPSLVEEALPQTLAVGLSYRASSQLRVLLDVFKDIAFPLSVRGGLEVRPVSMVALRAGVTTAPTRFTAGAGLRLGWFRADVAAEQHAELGWSPSASFQIQW